MNLDIFKGNWKQLKGQAQKTWGKLTDDDLDIIEGNVTELSGIIQKKYGISKYEADKQIQACEEEYS